MQRLGLSEWLDRQEIEDLITTYCRGIDRNDADLVANVFWDDARLDFTNVETTAAAFIAGRRATPADDLQISFHAVHNILCVLLGDVALAETYFTALLRRPAEDGRFRTNTTVRGRYQDRFERRAGAWRIARRRLVLDWVEAAADDGAALEAYARHRVPSAVLGGFSEDWPEFRAALLRLDDQARVSP